jgi:hypothetical protein
MQGLSLIFHDRPFPTTQSLHKERKGEPFYSAVTYRKDTGGI